VSPNAANTVAGGRNALIVSFTHTAWRTSQPASDTERHRRHAGHPEDGSTAGAPIRGSRLRGKQPKLKPRQKAHLVALLETGDHSPAELADLFGVGRSTVYRAVQRHQAAIRS